MGCGNVKEELQAAENKAEGLERLNIDHIVSPQVHGREVAGVLPGPPVSDVYTQES